MRKKDLPPPVPIPFGEESNSGSNEPLAKNGRTVEPAPVVEPTLGDVSSAPAVVRPETVEADVDQCQ